MQTKILWLSRKELTSWLFISLQFITQQDLFNFPCSIFQKTVVSKSVPGRFISRNCRSNFSVAGPVAVETEVE